MRRPIIHHNPAVETYSHADVDINANSADAEFAGTEVYGDEEEADVHNAHGGDTEPKDADSGDEVESVSERDSSDGHETEGADHGRDDVEPNL